MATARSASAARSAVLTSFVEIEARYDGDECRDNHCESDGGAVVGEAPEVTRMLQQNF